MIDEDPDAELVARCLRGETEAFEPLVERYQRPLFNLAWRMLGQLDDAIADSRRALELTRDPLMTTAPLAHRSLGGAFMLRALCWVRPSSLFTCSWES